MGREFELKYRATQAQQAALAEKFGTFREITMESTYYDTADATLSHRHITLRCRKENGTAVCTAKTPLADGSRGEWEVLWDQPENMIEVLCKHGAPEELKKLTAGGIHPVCGARFTRRAKSVEVPGGLVELALDRGILMGGGKELPLCEVEVELKSGDDSAAILFAQALAAEFALVPEKRSKFCRAQALAEGK